MVKTARVMLVLAGALVAGGLLFFVLAWRAEWIPRVIVRQELADLKYPSQIWTFEVRRKRVSRNWVTLFSSEVEPLRNYECRILSLGVLVTSAGTFFEASEPDSAKIYWIGPDEVFFDFGGTGSYVCKFSHGETKTWYRPAPPYKINNP